MPNQVRFLNIQIDNITFDHFLHTLEKGVVFTPNIDHLMKLQEDKAFYEAYQQADYRVCDSRIILALSRLSPNPIVDQITGADFFPAFCAYHAKKSDQTRIFLLGGTPESVVLAQKSINTQSNSGIISGAYSPPFGFEYDQTENRKIIQMISESGANVLAVGVGAPKQELWIMKHKEELPEIDIFFGIGKTIDFLAGVTSRAPSWMTRAGLEWFYRFTQEPARLFRRYFINGPRFFGLVFLQILGFYKNPWE